MTLTMYCSLDSWVFQLAQGWQLCGYAPEPRSPYWVMLWRPEW